MKFNTSLFLTVLQAVTITSSNAFGIHPSPKLTATPSFLSASVTVDDLTFTPPDVSNEGEIGEEACADAASLMKRAIVPVPEYISPNETVGISYIHWKAEKSSENKPTVPLILVHGFDSSCLEYRRLGPKLAALGIDTYAVDLLGWGYSQLNDVTSFSAQAKVDALTAFWNTVGDGKDVAIAGASLGGAAAIEFSASETNKDFIKGAIFIDAQGFVDGVGPMASLPKFLAQAGVQVLKSVPLRNSANQMSYYDKDTFATEDALKVGRFHCLREGWSDALVNFMLSGGFSPSTKVEKIDVPSLVLWGRQDGILEKEFAQKFLDTLPDAELSWVEECGHVPHLEQPEETANKISNFLRSEKFDEVNANLKGGVTVAIDGESNPTLLWAVGGIAGATAIAGTIASGVL
jgi:pimeloyl-ACP methyl ester carboxylesterase